jgi:hypothetical protein
MESVTIEGIDTANLRPDMSAHRKRVVDAFCKRHHFTTDAHREYAVALFNGVVRVPLIGGMLFAHKVPSAVKVLESAAILTHYDMVKEIQRKGNVGPQLSGSRVGNKNAGE